ncbi:hypothetical protein RMSM_05384 [Rhodopirellula maiorica SM1]|uniref:Uncharacterized protein n=1 Tax=Rhodopirellula maiorica SM1 TaxID=1265738 RepID=M5RQM0_9BACT|nr:hypothetical protein RMSM_05384 [Rhodopirellula maiorica SM1]
MTSPIAAMCSGWKRAAIQFTQFFIECTVFHRVNALPSTLGSGAAARSDGTDRQMHLRRDNFITVVNRPL